MNRGRAARPYPLSIPCNSTSKIPTRSERHRLHLRIIKRILQKALRQDPSTLSVHPIYGRCFSGTESIGECSA